MRAAFHLTPACNLRCTYCYAGTKTGLAMTPEVADRGMEFLFGLPDRDVVVTFFGGEPLMRFDLIRRIVEKGKALASGTPDRRLCWSMVTNGLLLTDEVLAFLRAHDVLFTLSFDGARESQDAHRRTADGRGSFDAVMRRVPAILSAFPYVDVNVVITPETAPRLAEGVKFLRETGFRRLHLQPDFGAAWDARGLRELARQYRKIADYYVECHRAGRKIHIDVFDDYIRAHALGGERLAGGPSPCDAGRDTISIAPSGRLYPCVQFVQDDGSAIGDVWRGFDAERVEAFRRVADQPAPECRACAFFGRCRNYCACANRQSTGDAGKPSAFLCEHERTLIPIADRAGATLWKERNPLFIDRIYNPAHALVSYVEERVSASKA